VVKIDETLPTGEAATLLYLGRGGSSYILYYLHKLRRGTATEDNCRAYEAMLPTYSNRLADLVTAVAPDADALIMIPSSRDDAKPYVRQILGRLNSPADLSTAMTRAGKVKEADGETTIERIAADMSYSPTGGEFETYGTGKSVTATLKVLRENGLEHSDKCKITIAVALKVK
jgi:hypothetical protein